MREHFGPPGALTLPSPTPFTASDAGERPQARGRSIRRTTIQLCPGLRLVRGFAGGVRGPTLLLDESPRRDSSWRVVGSGLSVGIASRYEKRVVLDEREHQLPRQVVYVVGSRFDSRCALQRRLAQTMQRGCTLWHKPHASVGRVFAATALIDGARMGREPASASHAPSSLRG